MKNSKKLLEKLEKSFNNAFEKMTLEDLKKIDWLTVETDFFIEKDQKKEAA